MGSLMVLRITLVCFFISATLIPTSFAGRLIAGFSKNLNVREEAVDDVQERFLLTVNTQDYGNQTPTPVNTLPPHADIPYSKISDVHERLLGANTQDYGNETPTPVNTLPPHADIPYSKISDVHERLLRANTQDYGNEKPTPANKVPVHGHIQH